MGTKEKIDLLNLLIKRMKQSQMPEDVLAAWLLQSEDEGNSMPFCPEIVDDVVHQVLSYFEQKIMLLNLDLSSGTSHTRLDKVVGKQDLEV